MDIADISVALSPKLPVWPGSVGCSLSRVSDLEAGDDVTVSRLDCDVHTGTHIDAPGHFVRGGALVEDLPLGHLIGPCLVADVGDVEVIDRSCLEGLGIRAGTERILFRTRNSGLWSQRGDEFQEDFTALTADAAAWIVEHSVRLVGIDYLSIQLYRDDPTTHRVLLGSDVVVLEGLDLSKVTPGAYFLVCLPLRLRDAEAAPARAVLLSAVPDHAAPPNR